MFGVQLHIGEVNATRVVQIEGNNNGMERLVLKKWTLILTLKVLVTAIDALGHCTVGGDGGCSVGKVRVVFYQECNSSGR